MADGSRNTAKIIAVMGASGSGKSAWIKQQLRAGNPARLLVWDPQEEFGAFGREVTDPTELTKAVREAGDGSYRLIYRPGKAFSTYGDKFDLFCSVAYLSGNACVVVDELGDVTEPSRAPDGWSVLSRKGRHRGLTVFGAAQRPANIDKDFIGNSSMVHCSRLSYETDIKVMANALGVPVQEVRDLKADPDAVDFDFIERNMQTGAVRRAKLTF
ncbi:hypothetical protein C6P96_08510 [Burkholderia multivorans]|nr:hypothetical protein C6P95_14430 [Burkholderia multivorans]PRF15249.1 hypothetical protein C6P96_08510 [Burkholderia multivorans]